MESDRSRDPTSVLEPYASTAEVVRELHAVPPYRVYEVRLDGERAVLKVDDHPRGHAAAEGRVQQYVADDTSVPVPEVRWVGTDHFVAAWDDDAPAPDEAETVDEAWAAATGRWMGRLHAETAGDVDGFGRPLAGDDGLAVDGHDTWAAALRSRLEYHQSSLETYGHADVVDVVDEFVRDEAATLDGAGGPVCCHGNLHPEHAAVRDGRVVSVVDFEHALFAPPEYDYWRLATTQFVARDDVDESVPEAFRDAYESEHALPSGLERRRPFYLLLNLVSYLESLYLQGNVPPEDRDEYAERYREEITDVVAAARADLD